MRKPYVSISVDLLAVPALTSDLCGWAGPTYRLEGRNLRLLSSVVQRILHVINRHSTAICSFKSGIGELRDAVVGTVSGAEV